jgi:hypothetical protein
MQGARSAGSAEMNTCTLHLSRSARGATSATPPYRGLQLHLAPAEADGPESTALRLSRPRGRPAPGRVCVTAYSRRRPGGRNRLTYKAIVRCAAGVCSSPATSRRPSSASRRALRPHSRETDSKSFIVYELHSTFRIVKPALTRGKLLTLGALRASLGGLF